ncbi:MAG: class I SAM-dependent methyltransferase [Christensenellaceae bacterium]|nr:class I SAM-dependent methyltransferase [Christensenellaceae bacterium]MEA5066700.1 class I SAM-dependent methyltransferase [Eubacteriales bacterium]MEA5069876.1 class I SAM-dependent methyltransferase [Christensenellaceae bacterium]
MYPAEFASVYDRLMDDVDYPGWASYYRRIAGLKAGDAACECGCGTGSMTVEFHALGLAMIGADLSEGMLRVAADKARLRGAQIAFIRQDMCALQLHRGVDAVLAPCDGVNYLLTGARVCAFFDGAYRALKPHGALAFDVSTPGKLNRLTCAPCYEDREDISYFWVSEADGPLVRMALTFFARQGGGLYRRFDERQTQRAHTLPELIAALEAAGFEDIRAYGEQTYEPATEADGRWHLVAHKP